RFAFRYQEQVNGSARNIAGILNDAGNVLGLMPHPERVVEPAHGGLDRRRLFERLLEPVAARPFFRWSSVQSLVPGGAMHISTRSRPGVSNTRVYFSSVSGSTK